MTKCYVGTYGKYNNGSLAGAWLDGRGLQYNVTCMGLEEFCEMVDAIVEQCNK